MASKNKMDFLQKEFIDLCDFSVKECVAHISEFAPATEYFEPEVGETIIKSLQQTPDLTGVILEIIASLHRPGILYDKVTFYNKSEEEMIEHLQTIERNEHVHWMFKNIIETCESWAQKFRVALGPKIKIVWPIDSDDFHHMVERMLRVVVQSATVQAKSSRQNLKDKQQKLLKLLNGYGRLNEQSLKKEIKNLENKYKKHLARREKKPAKKISEEIAKIKTDLELIDRLRRLKIRQKNFKQAENEKLIRSVEQELLKLEKVISIKENGLKNTLIDLQAKRELLVRVPGKQKKRDTLDAEIKDCATQIKDLENKLENLEEKIDIIETLLKRFGREPETSPVYGVRVSEHVRKMYERFQTIGEKYNIEIVTKPDILVFGSLVIDYAHDRGRTWNPMPGQAKNLAQVFQGRIKQYRKNICKTLKEMGASTNDIDVIMNSGHSGTFYARWQKTRLTTEEIRMQHVNTVYTRGNGVKHILYLSGMPCEAQHKIAKYTNRGKPGRTRAGKTQGTASHAVFIRAEKNSVSGITIIRKHNHDLLSVEPIMYELYKTKDVLDPFKAVMSQDDSDNHFNSPEQNILGTLGTLYMNDQLMKKPMKLYGKKVYIGGKFNLGDAGEANSRAWKEGHKFRRSVMESIDQIVDTITNTDQADYKSVLRSTIFYANDTMGGSNENLKLTQRIVDWYFKEQTLNVWQKSPTPLRDCFAHVSGNHFDNVSHDSAASEHDIFEDRITSLANLHKDFPELGIKPFSVRVEAGGEPDYFKKDKKDTKYVIHLGGYSVARQGIIEEYGIGSNSELFVQKTYCVGMTHEPNNIISKARNDDCDVIKAGHWHESVLTIDKAGDNIGRFIDIIATTQRVTPTELAIGGLPRTMGVELKIYTRPNRYFKMFIPMEHMCRIGLASINKMIQEKIQEKNKLAFQKNKKKILNKKSAQKKNNRRRKVETKKKKRPIRRTNK